MSELHVHDLNHPTVVHLHSTDRATIGAALAEVGIRFERWERPRPDAALDEAAILELFAEDIARLKAEGGYQACDVVRMTPDHPNRREIRAKFLHEHTHAEDEVRFFVEGCGMFYLHMGDRVFRLLCTADDLLSVPAGTPHWFDTGEAPHFTAIRLFTNPEGWVAVPTGEGHAERFPLMEEA